MRIRYNIREIHHDLGFIFEPVKETKYIGGTLFSEVYSITSYGNNLLNRKEIIDSLGGLKFYDRMEKWQK